MTGTTGLVVKDSSGHFGRRPETRRESMAPPKTVRIASMERDDHADRARASLTCVHARRRKPRLGLRRGLGLSGEGEGEGEGEDEGEGEGEGEGGCKGGCRGLLPTCIQA